MERVSLTGVDPDAAAGRPEHFILEGVTGKVSASESGREKERARLQGQGHISTQEREHQQQAGTRHCAEFGPPGPRVRWTWLPGLLGLISCNKNKSRVA